MSAPPSEGLQEDRRHAEGHHAERDPREQRVDGQHGEERQAPSPAAAPPAASSSDSIRKESRMAPRPKPERAQRADLGDATRDGGVHGVERAERRADPHDAGEGERPARRASARSPPARRSTWSRAWPRGCSVRRTRCAAPDRARRCPARRVSRMPEYPCAAGVVLDVASRRPRPRCRTPSRPRRRCRRRSSAAARARPRCRAPSP